MKKVIMICFLITTSVFAEELNKQQQAKQTALGIIASLTDTIATLIINKHYTKDPLVTKACCVDLVTQLADALAIAIISKLDEEKKSGKEVRSVTLHDVDAQINLLANVLTEKIGLCE